MRFFRTTCKEICLLRHILFDIRSYFLAKIALIAGFSYLFVPLDIIPDRIPYFGHLDEATSVISGFLIARLLAQPADHGLDLDDALPPANLSAAPIGARKTSRLFLLLGYRGWWLVNTPIGRRQSGMRGLVVVGGAARSGTTLLRGTLGRHPLIVSLPETTVFLRRITSAQHLGQRLRWNPVLIEQWQARSRSQVEFIERFHRAVLAESGRPIWLEKTPANVFRFGFVRRGFPRARLVHVIRDGRDVVCSLRWKPWAKIHRDIPRAAPEAARRCGMLWAASVRAGLARRHDKAYFELRYEDLVNDPEAVLRRLLDFLGIPWNSKLLAAAHGGGQRPHAFSDDWPDDVRESFERDQIAADGEVFRDSVGRWRDELSDADTAALQPIIGDLLIELGYESDRAWASAHSTPARAILLPQPSRERTRLF